MGFLSPSLRHRAVVFALSAGAVAFVLALLATTRGDLASASAAGVLIPAVVLAAFCWASAERNVASVAGAIDEATARLADAVQGDLESATPPAVAVHVPELAAAMNALFTEQRRNLEAVEALARYDTVTALSNRAHFRATCERMLDKMPEDHSAALLFIDLDRFKAVNDTLGHANGDQLLHEVAERLRGTSAALRCPDNARPVIGRLAGDEFTVFLPCLAEGRDTAAIGRELLAALSAPFAIAGQQVTVGASIGVAERPAHGKSLAELMRAADAAMYRAKASGRARVDRYDDTLAEAIAARTLLARDLHEAIDRREFALEFQPQLTLDGEGATGEALLRWRHPDGVRLPGSFIAQAEETGQIVEIGAWVMAEVAATVARWHALGHHHRLAVNVSTRELMHAGFFDQLRATMATADAPLWLLELEITESLAMDCPAETIGAIAALRADGVTIAIDDFGTGHSNLARLRRLPIDRVKLDRTLIHDVATGAEARTIVQAVIGLIHGIGCTAVAEGIETEAQAEVLRVIGCDVLQGYAIAPPMDEVAFLHWSRDRTQRRLAS